MLRQKHIGVIMCVFFCLGSFINSYAQEYSDRTIRQYTIEDGLSDNYIECMFQDSYGFMWFGTRDGLNRFDGKSFRVFKHDKYDTTSIVSNYITDICEDSEKNIWTITNQQEICRYNQVDNNFERLSISNDSIDPAYGVFPTVIFEDVPGTLLVGTSAGVFFMTKDTAKSGKLNYCFTRLHDSGYVTAILRDSKKNIWIGTRRGLVFYKYIKADNSLKRYPNIVDSYLSKSNVKVNSIVEDAQGRVWVATEQKGLIAYSPETELFSSYRIVDGNSDKTIQSVLEVFLDSKQNLWVSPLNYGVYKYSSECDCFEETSINSQNSIQGNKSSTVSEIIESGDELLWMGTHGSGIFSVIDEKSPVRHYMNTKDGLSHNIVTSFSQDRNGTIWIGTDGGGVNVFNPDSNSFQYINMKNGLSSNVVLDIEIDHEHKIWFSTWGGGVSVYDSTTSQIVNYKSSDTCDITVSFDHIKALYFDQNRHVMWIGTHGNGVNVYDYKKQVFERIVDAVGDDYFSQPIWVNQIIKDFRGVVWFATVHGLFAIQNKGFIAYISDPLKKSTISNNNVNTIFEDSNRRLWVGTAEGLCLYDRTNDEFIRYDIPELSNIKAINEDNSGILWISTKQNIYQLNPKTSNVVMLNIVSGQSAKYFVQRATLKGNDGEMYFGSLDGFYTFHPDSILENKFIAPIYITDVKIFHKSKGIGIYGYRNTNAHKIDPDMILNPNESVITFDFAALNYIEPQKMQFAYKLEGFDNTWRIIGNERKATFTNLNQGTYIFRVKTCNGDGVWNKHDAFFKIKVLPPWYKTWWFRYLLLILVVALPLGFYIYRIFNIQKINQKLDRLVTQRTEELEKANKKLRKKQSEVEKKNQKLNEQKTVLEGVNRELIELSDKVLRQHEQIYDQKQALEKANSELNEVNKTKDKFFSIIAHDLKNPINGLIGLSDILKEGFDNMESGLRQNYLAYINDSSKYIYSLLTNLLNWARAQSGAIKFVPKNIDINTVIDSNIALLEKSVLKKNITIDKNVEINRKLYADVNMINTVVRNLLSNSIKFTLHGGNISLIARENNGDVELIIKDSGVGMSLDQIDDLFKIDSYSSTLGTDKEKGTGLGLIICKEFIEVHNGKIKIDSVVGEGTAITITLPKRKY